MTKHQTLPPQTISIANQVRHLHTTVNKHEPLQHYIHQLPPKYQSYLQYWEDEQHSMDIFGTALTRNTIHIASDRSHLPDTGYGAGASVMMNEAGDDDIIIMIGAK